MVCFFLLVCAYHSLAFVFEKAGPWLIPKNIRSSSFCERICQGENSKKNSQRPPEFT